MFMRMGEAARQLGFHPVTIYRLEKQGKISRIPRARSGQRVFTPELIKEIERQIYPDLYASDSKLSGGESRQKKR
jgi:DNA-binding transcriptional MerR regulator